MFDTDTRALLEGGSALIVATVAADGTPHAGRGWGLTLLDDRPGAARLLVSADDELTCAHLATGGAVAVTAADVPTLRSVQLKGRSVGLEPADAADRARAEVHLEALFTDIETTDGAARSILDRWRTRGYAACTILVEERYDQTPGPGAGGAIRAAST